LDVLLLGALAFAVHRFGGNEEATKTPAEEPVPETV
jgi:hypothetical protein